MRSGGTRRVPPITAHVHQNWLAQPAPVRAEPDGGISDMKRVSILVAAFSLTTAVALAAAPD